MERTARNFASAPSSFRASPYPIRPARDRRLDSTNPKSRRVNQALRAAEYDQFARNLQRDLGPRGPLEQIVTRQAIRSAWRLKANLEAIDAVEIEETSEVAERAARSLEVAITTLDLLQGRRFEPLDHSIALDARSPADDFGDSSTPIESNEWPVVPPASRYELTEEAEEAPIWQGRLAYDFDVSDHSPVIKGTWITVSHVVSLIVDGATWADILRSHPELVEEDIRVCVAYAVAEDGSDV